MGSQNSEHSGSMDSDEFSNLIGHNYANAHVLRVTLPLENEVSLLMGNSSKSSNNSHTSVNVTTVQDVTSSQDNTLNVSTENAQDNTSLHKLQENLVISKGILTLTNPEKGECSKQNEAPSKNVSWSSLVQRNIPNEKHHNSNVAFTYNGDGLVNLMPSDEFLHNGRKQWDTSIIGHFIGGSFDFKFVREQTFKIWKNGGLSKVYYSSKGYFTMRFNSVEAKDAALGLHSVQIGGKTMYLKPWMEGSKFRKNILDKVSCWIRLVDVPFSYWSSKGLTAIADTIGPTLKFDEATSRFEPLKYARVQIELSYKALRPPSVFVPIINADGVRDIEKVDVEYSTFPYSCSLCQAFGHSLSRCINNPERVRPTPR